MEYEGIKLDMPAGNVSLTHSHAADMIFGKSSNQNTSWLDALGEISWSKVQNSYPEYFEQASKIFSLVSMNYQVCNGGIDQYFFNGYHEERDPYSENDVKRVDIEAQKGFFYDVLTFAKTVFPERTNENTSLEEAYDAFDELWYEKDAIVMETVYCEEDEYIWDEDLEEDVPNPDYFEPYDEPTYEDIIHGENGFDVVYENAIEYIEELLELQAQLCCKKLAQEVMKNKNVDLTLLDQLKTMLPEAAFKKPALAERITEAAEKTKSPTSIVEREGLSGPDGR